MTKQKSGAWKNLSRALQAMTQRSSFPSGLDYLYAFLIANILLITGIQITFFAYLNPDSAIWIQKAVSFYHISILLLALDMIPTLLLRNKELIQISSLFPGSLISKTFPIRKFLLIGGWKFVTYGICFILLLPINLGINLPGTLILIIAGSLTVLIMIFLGRARPQNLIPFKVLGAGAAFLMVPKDPSGMLPDLLQASEFGNISILPFLGLGILMMLMTSILSRPVPYEFLKARFLNPVDSAVLADLKIQHWLVLMMFGLIGGVLGKGLFPAVLIILAGATMIIHNGWYKLRRKLKNHWQLIPSSKSYPWRSLLVAGVPPMVIIVLTLLMAGEDLLVWHSLFTGT